MKKNVVVALLNYIAEETQTDIEDLVNIGAELMGELKGQDKTDLREALSQTLLEYYGLATKKNEETRFYNYTGGDSEVILTENTLLEALTQDKDSMFCGWDKEEARTSLRDFIEQEGSFEGWYEVMVE